MPPKAAAKEKVVSVKGDEAEELVLQYLKQVNRPYASTDVSANLKNKVTKVNAQKVLQSLADKGSLTMKMYGKQSVFVYNQDDLDTLPAEALAELDNEIKVVLDDVDSMKKKLRILTSELSTKLAQPKTEDLQATIDELKHQNEITLKHLQPLRDASSQKGSSSGSSGGSGVGGPMSEEELAMIEKEWATWRKEWTSRKKVYQSALDACRPDAGPHERLAYEEDIGIEPETDEAVALERSDLCKPGGANKIGSGSGRDSGRKVVVAVGDKRKRS